MENSKWFRQMKADPFLVGNNSYVDMRFKFFRQTLSGMDIHKAISIFPSVKADVSVLKEVVSGSYKIWNRDGASVYCTPPPADAFEHDKN